MLLDGGGGGGVHDDVRSLAGGRMAVPASRRPEVMLKELVAVVDVLEANVETLSVLVNEEEELELCDGGPWLGLLLTDMLLPLLLSELDLAC